MIKVALNRLTNNDKRVSSGDDFAECMLRTRGNVSPHHRSSPQAVSPYEGFEIA